MNFNCTINFFNILKCSEKHLYSVYQDTVSLFEYKYRLSSEV